MTVFIILLVIGVCVVFPLYCAFVVASREDKRLEKRDAAPPKTGRPEKEHDRKFKNMRRELSPPPRYSDEDRKN